MTDWSTYETTNYFASYNVETGKYTEGSFLVDAPAELSSTSIYSMETNPYNDYFYVVTTDFATNGKVYVFDENFKYVTNFQTTGVNPKTFVFFY